MIPSVGEDMEQQESSYFAGWLQKDTTILENSLAVSYKQHLQNDPVLLIGS